MGFYFGIFLLLALLYMFWRKQQQIHAQEKYEARVANLKVKLKALRSKGLSEDQLELVNYLNDNFTKTISNSYYITITTIFFVIIGNYRSINSDKVNSYFEKLEDVDPRVLNIIEQYLKATALYIVDQHRFTYTIIKPFLKWFNLLDNAIAYTLDKLKPFLFAPQFPGHSNKHSGVPG